MADSQDKNIGAQNFRSPNDIRDDLSSLKIIHDERIEELKELKASKSQLQEEKKLYKQRKLELQKELLEAKQRVREQKEIAKAQRAQVKAQQDAIKQWIKFYNNFKKQQQQAQRAQQQAQRAQAKAQQQAQRAQAKAQQQAQRAQAKAQQQAQRAQAKAQQQAQRAQAKAQQQAQRAQQQAQRARQQSINKIKQSQKSSRRKVWNQLNEDFPDSRIARALYRQYVDKTGKMSTEGQFVAGTLQTQDRFIKKLVNSLAQLPVFQTLKRGLHQLAGITFLKGASDITHGNIIGGLGEILLSGLIFAVPSLVSALVQTLLPIFSKNIIGIIQKATIPLLKNIFTGLPNILNKLFKVGRGLSAVYGLPQFGSTGTVSSLSGFGKIGALLGKFVPFFTKILGPLAGLVSVFQSMKNLFSGKGKGTDWLNLLSGITLVLAPFFGPAAPIVAGVAGILQGITAIIDNWKGIKSWFKDHWPFGKDKIQNDGGSGKNYTISPSYNRVGVTNVDKAIKWQDAGKMQTFTNAEGTWDYYRFGGSPDNMGQGYWLEEGFNSKAWSKERLNNFAKSGMYNLEALKGGNGIQIANTFYNDAMAGRKGSNILLQTAAARMKQMGHGDLILTSALASATSGHAKGYFGHSGGQTFDFSAAGLSKEQAIQYAKDLKSTGLFSHTQAEYNRKTGEWHIDARFSDQAYNELNKQAQKANEDKRPINQTVAEQKKPTNQMVAEQKKQQPAQTEFDNVINNSLAISKGIFEKANYR